MRWGQISVETTVQGRDVIANLMIENGCGGVVIHGEAPVVVKGYLPVDDRLEPRLLNIREGIKAFPESGLEIGSGEITITYIEDEEWSESWKQFFHTTRIGKRIVIKPTWEEVADLDRKDIVIELDPGMAFGTGTHPTTKLCLEALEKQMKRTRGNVVIDFGTGSGILAIAAAKMRARLVIAFDADETAVRAARENVVRNNTDNVTEVHLAESPAFINIQADIVTANIISETIMAYAEEIARLLRSGGTLIASGITKVKALEVEQSLRNVGFNIAEKLTEGEWVALVAKKVG